MSEEPETYKVPIRVRADSPLMQIANEEIVALKDRLAAREKRMREVAAIWYHAMAAWNDGPPTMKATADWANKWVPELARAAKLLEGLGESASKKEDAVE